MKKNTNVLPLPEMLSRRDRKNANRWQVDTCAPVRGEPMTEIIGAHMIVPVGNDEVDRVIRAHEMMHARISPAEDFGKWIARGIATEQGLTVVEEARVNYLIGKAGFDTKVLADGSETTSGMRLAEQGDWAQCVYATVAYAFCGGGKDFLTGVRRVNRAWGATLRDIVKRLERELKRADNAGMLASTKIDERTGLSPVGFSHVERLAEWVDRLANAKKDQDQDGAPATNNGEKRVKDGEKKTPGNGASDNEANAPDVKNIAPTEDKRTSGAVPTWAPLRVKHLPLVRHLKGGLGKKRVASAIGRNPRRMNNALTDPNRRIFDATKKGNGGIVLIDGSGSMSLEASEIIALTEEAPGCTVAVYSADKAGANDNLWVIAKDGKMVDTIPTRNGGNGVDGEAIRWAVSQRKSPRTPIVWVTDGGVHGLGTPGAWGGYDDRLAMDCIKTVLANGVHMAHDVADGTALLRKLRLGQRPNRWFPRRWQATYQRVNGRPLV